jgi:hypothetical protein
MKGLLASLLVVLLFSACPPNGSGSFTGGNEKDAGPGDGGTDLSAIGSRCVYDPSSGESPTNTCPVGLQCLIVTRDFAFTSGMALDVWEDHFSIYQPDGTDEGYCTLVGNLNSPPVCPIGTVGKLFTGGTIACLRTCSAEGECGRSEYTCDARYLDLVDATGAKASCVRRCGLDVPDCVRSGVIQNPAAPNELITVLAQEDLTGLSTCGEGGVCAFLNQRTGGSGPGEPCVTSDDCDLGSTCYQGPLLAAVLGSDAQAPGFCASPCFPGLGADACTTGYACQTAGSLSLGFDNTLIVNMQSGAVSQAGGFCFFTCEAGVAGNCDSVPQSECGQIDEDLLSTQWNGASMCLPDSVRR